MDFAEEGNVSALSLGDSRRTLLKILPDSPFRRRRKAGVRWILLILLQLSCHIGIFAATNTPGAVWDRGLSYPFKLLPANGHIELNQRFPLAVPADVSSVPPQNSFIRVTGVWAEFKTSSSSTDSDRPRVHRTYPQHSPSDDQCVSLINVGGQGVPPKSDKSITGATIRTLSDADMVNGNDEIFAQMKELEGETHSHKLSLAKFPSNCEESFSMHNHTALPPYVEIDSTVVCGADKRRSTHEYLVFSFPVVLLQYIYGNFDLGPSLKAAADPPTSAPKDVALETPTLFSMWPEKPYLQHSNLQANVVDGEHMYSVSRDPMQVAEKANIRVCFRNSSSEPPIEIGRAVFHKTPSPNALDPTRRGEVEIRKFLNPGWSWTKAMEGANFTDYNFLSLKSSTDDCQGFHDEDAYLSIPPSEYITTDNVETVKYHFDENFRASRGHHSIVQGPPQHYSLCLYSDENEEKGAIVETVEFVLDPRDASLCVAFIVFVLLCIFVCGISISCYAFKHKRLRKQLRRLRLVQQRDEIERRLMVELGIGDAHSDDEGAVERSRGDE